LQTHGAQVEHRIAKNGAQSSAPDGPHGRSTGFGLPL
jgi:hypothetical protein